MKSIFFAVLFALAFGFLCRADVVIPKPTYFTVTNLTAFPKYKFSYTTDYDEPTHFEPIKNGQSYQIRPSARLYVQEADGPRHQWMVIKVTGREEQYISIVVKEIQLKDNEIVVIHKDTIGSTPPKKGTADAEGEKSSSMTFFALSSFGVCGLVLLARRNRSVHTPL